MKLLSFEMAGRASYGIAAETGVIDLTPRLGTKFADLRALLDGDGLKRARDLAEVLPPDIAWTDIHYLPPVPKPEKIFCVGVNYANRNEEYRDQLAEPEYPSIFMRGPRSLVGHGASIIRPRESIQLDYEGEIALIIGKSGRRIAEAEALNHVAGLTLCNEGTLRDWVRHGKFNVTPGKNFDSSGSIGPWLVTRDEFSSLDDLRLQTRVNGELRQNDTTLNMIFPFHYLIRYISSFAELVPGDIIVTGTPTGAGARFDPPRYLKPGDAVEIEVAGIGTLRNQVADE